MPTSGSRNFIMSRNDIIISALKGLGVVDMVGTPNSLMIDQAAQILNIMVAGWMNEDIFLWTQQDEIALLTAATPSVTLDSDTVEISDVFFRKDGKDRLIAKLTREEYKAIVDKKAAGEPVNYYIDDKLAAPVLYLYPVHAYSTGLVLGTDASSQLCILDHTSSADSMPITGADYATNWESTALETATLAWVTATAYYSGVIHFTKNQRLQDFDQPGDNPDFPIRWYSALVWGLMADLAPRYGRKPDFYVIKAEAEKAKAKMSNSESGDLVISPRL